MPDAMQALAKGEPIGVREPVEKALHHWLACGLGANSCAVLPTCQSAPIDQRRRGWLGEMLLSETNELVTLEENSVLRGLGAGSHAAHLFFQLISRRYERGSVLITSNRPVMEWGEVFGDKVVATAILDRLLHHSHVLTVRGDSYRLREKRRSGLIKNSSAVSTIPATREEGSP